MAWRYQKGLTINATVETLYYYLGGKLVALKQGSTMSYVAQDHLGGTLLTTDASGNVVDQIKYAPYGSTRSGDITSIEKKFTGQRLDGTGLYYYGARYYAPALGRFISADTIVPHPANPQNLNRYSYALNNLLKYVDPIGRWEFYADSAMYDFAWGSPEPPPGSAPQGGASASGVPDVPSGGGNPGVPSNGRAPANGGGALPPPQGGADAVAGAAAGGGGPGLAIWKEVASV